MKVHYGSPLVELLPHGTRGFTFGEHVFVGARATQGDLLHEAAHVIQYRQYGLLGFTLRHLWWNVRYGYWMNPLEVEARRFQTRRQAAFSPEENRRYLQTL